MTADEYANLMDFLANRFARMDERFERIDERLERIEERLDVVEGRLEVLEGRLTRAEVLREDMRHEIRLVSEALSGLIERVDEHDRKFDHMTGGLDRLQVQFDRFAVDFGTVYLDHSARIEALERQRER